MFRLKDDHRFGLFYKSEYFVGFAVFPILIGSPYSFVCNKTYSWHFPFPCSRKKGYLGYSSLKFDSHNEIAQSCNFFLTALTV